MQPNDPNVVQQTAVAQTGLPQQPGVPTATAQQMPVNPTPVQPYAQPAPSAQTMGGIQSPAQTAAQRPWAYVSGIGSFVVLAVGLFFGYASIFGVLLGGYAGQTGYRLKSTPLIIVGYTGMAINAILLIIAIIQNG